MDFEITYFFYAALGSVLVGLSNGGLLLTGMLAVSILSLLISPIHASTLLLHIYRGSLARFTSFISHAGALAFQVYVLSQKLSKADFLTRRPTWPSP